MMCKLKMRSIEHKLKMRTLHLKLQVIFFYYSILLYNIHRL